MPYTRKDAVRDTKALCAKLILEWGTYAIHSWHIARYCDVLLYSGDSLKELGRMHSHLDMMCRSAQIFQNATHKGYVAIQEGWDEEAHERIDQARHMMDLIGNPEYISMDTALRNRDFLRGIHEEIAKRENN